ncbi:MAG: type II toxin-antitoxin system VapC family toxin [Gammaproteobacteria bacterium]
MSNFVLDASVALSWCFPDEATPETIALLKKLERVTAFVPAIWPLELGNILVNAERKKRIKYAELVEFIGLLQELNIRVDPKTVDYSFHETLQLAYANKLTTYDSSYLELAIRLGIPLATKDKDLQSAATRLGVKVL